MTEIEKLSKIQNNNLITGELLLSEDSKMKVNKVEIFLEDIKEPIAEIETETFDGGVKFQYLIDSRARVGKYSVVWMGSISGKESKIFDNLSMGDDNIDRTLHLELHHLSRDIVFINIFQKREIYLDYIHKHIKKELYLLHQRIELHRFSFPQPLILAV